MADENVDAALPNLNASEEDNPADEPDFDDPEDFIDDISDEELLGDLMAQEPKLDDSLEQIIVVDNVPRVMKDRLDRLKNVIRKIMGKFGRILSEYYPADENGETKGFIFLEYETAQQAANAVKTAHGYRLDKAHVFAINPISDFEKYSDLPTHWEPPEPKEYTPQENLRSWLLNPDCHDQYAVIYSQGDKTAVCWNTNTEPIIVISREHWTEAPYLRWSPQGTYFVTIHKQGAALWGGENFRRIQRFSHLGTEFIDFSPCERFLVTFSSTVDSSEEPQAIMIWDIRTGAKMRGFNCEEATVWPVFKWSHDGRYFARQRNGLISVYESETFGLLDKKSIQVSDVRDFAWSPAENYLAYWLPEVKENPSRVVLLEIPSKKEIRMKNLFNVSACELYWQKCGDFLCVKVGRLTTKSKKSATAYNLEVFSVRAKLIPVDSIEIKEPLVAFAWEPNGSKFGVIHGEGPQVTVRFYKVEPEGAITHIKTFEKKTCNQLLWSPQGQFVVLTQLRGPNSGLLEFYDTSDMTQMNTGEHFQATDVAWDPTGRYLSSFVSWYTVKGGDHGYLVWSFQGKQLYRQNMPEFGSLVWRPRPPSLLNDIDIQEIRRQFKKYQREFEMKDRLSQKKASKELVDKRRQMMTDFQDYRKKKERDLTKLYRDRTTPQTDDGDDSFQEEVIEFLINEEIVTVEDN
ncbi:eukaryotic translation initiation factor 3 subunit B-like [Corticium candelabrum]|uniref:eukaryotic translation initiation factor 3 subunit B-like n=1 Tax=Corticium candelabrum TaxID=121492 RepID=UPI002E377C5B|nr:eukaryotic translation initiation factor 3 subunit B-like [Corticium candelabrum]